MATTLTIEIPDEIYEPLAREAEQRGETPEQVVLQRLSHGHADTKSLKELPREDYDAALARLMKHAGAVSVPDPTNADNKAIDRDLVREYASTHEDEI